LALRLDVDSQHADRHNVDVTMSSCRTRTLQCRPSYEPSSTT
jgi:hypothetical protein